MAAEKKMKTAERPKAAPEEIDPVAESSDESFPASDAPGWTSSGDGRSELKKRRKKRA